MLDYINPFSENFILKGVLEALQYINPFSENFIFKDFFRNIGDILSYINPFSENFFGWKIIDGIKGVLEDLFIPDNSLINDKIEEIKSRFSFINGVKQTINDITTIVYDENNTPTLSISIPENRTGITQVEVINLGWYSKYKTYGDAIICCFAYAFFFWRIFIKMPNIINGSAGETSGIVSDGVRIFGKENKR